MSNIKRVLEFSEDLQELTLEEFTNFVADILIANNNKYKNVQRGLYTQDKDYSLSAEELLENNTYIKAKFQIKRSDVVTPDYIRHIGNYWRTRPYFKTSHVYIVTEGILTAEAKKEANIYGIKIWDLYQLYALATPEFNKNRINKRTNFTTLESREDNLSVALSQLAKGPLEWSTYQLLASDIFTHLFSPPLSDPRYEHSDADERNRRDMIYENSTDHSFWKMIREIYQAHYIVIDAKNSVDLIDKRPVIDIAHYLKPYGCGMFGILLTRVGSSNAAKHAIKEQWIGNNKMIIALNDNDLLEMLKVKKANNKPEEIIRMKLADFRMSL